MSQICPTGYSYELKQAVKLLKSRALSPQHQTYCKSLQVASDSQDARQMPVTNDNTKRTPIVNVRKYESDDYCEFELLRTDVSVANALRRIIIAQVGPHPLYKGILC